jgi:hypothetical protein
MIDQPRGSSAAAEWTSCNAAARHLRSRTGLAACPPGRQTRHRTDIGVAVRRLPLLRLGPVKESEVAEEERSRRPGEDGDHPRRRHPDVRHRNHHPSSGPRGLLHHPEEVGEDLAAPFPREANVRNRKARHIGARMHSWSRALPDDEMGLRYDGLAAGTDRHGARWSPRSALSRLRPVGVECLDRSGAGTRVRAEFPCYGR